MFLEREDEREGVWSGYVWSRRTLTRSALSQWRRVLGWLLMRALAACGGHADASPCCRNNGIKIEGGKAVAEALRHVSGLQTLDLG